MTEGNGVHYHGLAERNPDGIPFFIQWGHRYPVLTYSDKISSTVIEMKRDLDVAYKIERLRGQVRDYNDFILKCQQYRDKHDEKKVT